MDDEFYGWAYFLKCPECGKKYYVTLYEKQNVMYFYDTNENLLCNICKKKLICLCAGKIVESFNENKFPVL